jgi:hypothetical protein
MSLYPAPELRGEIQFVFMKSWPYTLRMAVIILCFIAGLVIQFTVNFWLGLGLLLAGTLIGFIRGYHPKPKTGKEETWNRVTPDEFKKVVSKEKQLQVWDRDAFDITNKLGCSVLLIMMVIFAVLSFVVSAVLHMGSLVKYILLDSLVVLMPHWITGIRTYLKKDQLILKIGLLEFIMKQLTSDSTLQVHPMLSVQKTGDGKQVPKDVRLMIRFLNAPEDFLGIQVQISVNTVQGSDYPYLYCVLLGRERAGLLDKSLPQTEPSPNIQIERSKSEDVEVLVIRQKTTRTSGYHTDKNAAWQVMFFALKLGRKLVA